MGSCRNEQLDTLTNPAPDKAPRHSPRPGEKEDTSLHFGDSSQHEYIEEISAEDQRKQKALVRKLDCFIAPVLMLLNLISYLDRGNIGFAATQGMTRDIHLEGSDLNVKFTHAPDNSWYESSC